jgi:hypothetical protein
MYYWTPCIVTFGGHWIRMGFPGAETLVLFSVHVYLDFKNDLKRSKSVPGLHRVGI